MLLKGFLGAITPMKSIISVVALFAVLTVLLVAASGASAARNYIEPNMVHRAASSFTQREITINKGSDLTLVSDTAQTHVITNGSWDSNGNPQSKAEHGAPIISATFSDDNPQSFGPFNTSGTYHLYCTIHPSMNLTVVVQ